MKIRELVQTYKLINDPNAPPWSVKFVGAILVVALLAGGFAFVLWSGSHDAPSSSALMSTTQANADGSRTDYVGYAPGAGADAVDAAKLSAMMESWRAQHPGAQILHEEPNALPGGLITGYTITYRAS